MAFYVFTKDAKGYEHARRAAVSDFDLMAQTLAADSQPLALPVSVCDRKSEETPHWQSQSHTMKRMAVSSRQAVNSRPANFILVLS